MYQSRLREATAAHGEYTKDNAIRDYYSRLQGQKTDALIELNYYERKRVHHLKYFTWIEQQGFETEELNKQWYDDNYWTSIQQSTTKIDQMIVEFNERVGLL